MKVVVGTNTIVKKVTVGTPIRVGSAANGSLTGLDDVNGSVNLSDGTILQYDSNSGKFIHVSPATITGSGLDVTDGGGLGSLNHDSALAVLTYTGPSSDSIHSLFNATYDSSSLGTLSYSNGTVRLVGPTDTQIRNLFSAGNDLTYDPATGEFSVNVPDTSTAFDSNFALKTTSDLPEGSNLYYTDSRGRSAISVTDAGGFGSLAYNSPTGEITYTGPSVSDMRSVINVGANLAYDSATGKITFTGVLNPPPSEGGTALNVVTSGDYGSLSYDQANAVLTHVGVNDSDIRGAISTSGDLTYDQNTGIISFTERTDAQIRSLFNVGGDLGYDTATGVFSVDLGSVDVTDSAVTRALFSVTNDAGDYGSLAYDASSGQFTFTKVTDSDIRSSLSAQTLADSAALGSLVYDSALGKFTYSTPTAAGIRNLFSAGGDLLYDPLTGVFNIDVHSEYQDSDARHAIDFIHNADSVANVREYGDVSYNKNTGLVTIFGTRDSDIRGSLTVQDSGGLGSLTYIEKEGRFVFRGAGVDSLFSYFSVDENPTSLGDLYLDSASGSIRFQLDEDSIRRLISVVSDNEGGTHLSYDHSTGVITYRGPSTLEVRDLISVDSLANVGDGSLVYHESSGVFTYIGPQAFETRKHFNAGLGLDYDSGTGTYRIDSTSNSIMNALRADSAVSTPLLQNENDNITIHPQSGNLADSDGLVAIKGSVRIFNDLTVNGSFDVTGSQAVFNVSQLTVEDPTINIGKDIDTTTNAIDGAGLIFGTDSANGTGPLEFLFNYDSNRWQLNRGINIDGTLVATNIVSPTTLSLQQQIDALPDSAESRNLFSAGPGLTYDNNLGIYRITSSGVVAGQYGNATNVARFAVDSLGQIDSIEDIPIAVVEGFAFDSSSGQLKISTGTAAPNWDKIKTEILRVAVLDFTYPLYDFLVDSRGDGYLYGDIDLDGQFGTQNAAAPNPITSNDASKANLYDQTGTTGNALSDAHIEQYFIPELRRRRISDPATYDQYFDSAEFSVRLTLDPYTTNDLVEGDSNLYYTTSRFDSDLRSNTSRTTVRSYFSVNDQGGQGALSYDSALGQITYTGAVIRKAGNGLDLDSDTGTFRTDSTADVIFNSVQATASVTTSNLSTDSASAKILRLDPNQWTDVNVPDNIPWPRQEGDLFYFQGPDALTYSNPSMNVKIGQDEIVRVYNNTGSTIAKGKVVYVTGATNDFPTIALAQSNTLETVYETQGLTSHEIPDASYGFVTVRGLYGGLNTTQFNVGDIVHVSPDSAGELVNYSPQFPNYPFEVGVVLVADSATGGNVGGCIQVGLRAEVFENIRVSGNSRFDADVTIAGNLNLLGSETQTKVANLAVSDNFVFLAAGDTVTAQALDSGLNDLSFVGTYTGDSDLAYYMKIQNADSLGDVLVWSFDSNFASLEPFESAGGPTLWNLTTNGLSGDLKYGISFEFEAATGHDSGERWQGDAAPSNLDLGLIGNYNPPDGPFARTGAFRDNADGRFKFFEGYTSEITTSINTSDSSYQDANIQFGTGYGNIVGNVQGNVTGQVSDISNHNTTHLTEDPNATDSSGTMYFTSARARASIQAVDAGGDGSFVYDSALGTMTYTGPSEAEWYQHFVDNADSFGDMVWDSSYGTKGGLSLHERHILKHQEVFADSFINSQEYFLYYSGTLGELRKVSADTLANRIGGGAGGGAGGGLLSYVNL